MKPATTSVNDRIGGAKNSPYFLLKNMHWRDARAPPDAQAELVVWRELIEDYALIYGPKG